jgi:hypothetical protein
MVSFRFKLDRTQISKAGMQPGTVIRSLDVTEDGSASLGQGGEALVVDHFVFESAPEGFDEGVIVAIALAAHGSDQTVLSEDLAVSRAGKLHPTVRVDDESSSGAPLEKRHAQAGDNEAGIKDLMSAEDGT